jgi:FtsH-like protein
MAEEQKKNNQNTPHNSPKGNKPKNKFNFYWIYGILAVIIIGMQFLDIGSESKKTTWPEIKNMLEDGDVQRLVLVNKERAEVYIKKEALHEDKFKDVSKGDNFGGATAQYYYVVTSPESFENKVMESQKKQQRSCLC